MEEPITTTVELSLDELEQLDESLEQVIEINLKAISQLLEIQTDETVLMASRLVRENKRLRALRARLYEEVTG